jgi:hypothetical protein
MPIYVNLLAETQAAEDMRRRDPVKRAAFVGISLAAVALVWSGMAEVNAVLARERLDSVETAINSKTNSYTHVIVDQRKAGVIQTKLAALQKLHSTRFLQGTLLNALQHATVEGVQLTQLRLDQSYFLTEGTESQTNGDRVIAGRPTTVKERIILHLQARDSGNNPGDHVNTFEQAIAREPSYFQGMLDKTNAVQLAGPPSAPQFDAAGKPFVLFTVDCRFPEVTR